MISNAWAVRLAFFAIGFSPIGAVCLATFGILPMHISGPCVVLPAIVAGALICFKNREYLPRVIEGLSAGIIAVALYDMTRMPFLSAGVWPDFIPKLGSYLLNEPASFSLTHCLLGYAWRYLGNGGGMGLAFYMIFSALKVHWDLRLVGTLYGISIFVCLVLTVYGSPDGRRYLFDPTLLTGTLGLIGHIVYGFALGAMTLLFERRR